MMNLGSQVIGLKSTTLVVLMNCIQTAMAISTYDWNTYNRLISISEGTLPPESTIWHTVGTVAVSSAAIGPSVLRAMNRLLRQNSTIHITQWQAHGDWMNELELICREIIGMAASMKSHITLLETELGMQPSAEQIATWKEAVKNLANAEGIEADMKQQISELKVELATRPFGDDTEKEKSF
jgi:hypothetical protein